MMDPMQVHCLAPWKALCVKSNGLVVTDVLSRGILGDLRFDNIDTILSSNLYKEMRDYHARREFHPDCAKCILKESNGGHSRRKFFDDVLRNQIATFDPKLETKNEINFLEIITSNKCNLKCRMCSGRASSLWEKDEKLLLQNNFSYDRPKKSGYITLEDNWFENLFSETKIFDNLLYLCLRGGEPFLEEKSLQVLEHFIDKGLAPNITLDISTNGTVVDKKVVDYFSKYKAVDLYVSLEDVADSYGYIRGGNHFSLKELESNILKIRKLDNVTIIFTITSMIYNVNNIVNIWKWIETVLENGDEVSFSNTVVDPSYLNYRILPKSYKEMCAQRIEQSSLPLGEFNTGHRILRNIGLPSLVKGLRSEVDLSLEDLSFERKKFFDFTRLIDGSRGDSLENTNPELYSITRSWGNL